MSALQMNGRLWLLLVVLSVLWGGSFFFAEVALKELEPLTIVFGRVSLAALALLGFVYLSGERMPGGLKAWGPFFVMGGLNNLIPFSLIVWGQTHIDSGLASILNATTPLFTVALAHLLTTDEKLSANKGLGIVCGIVGVAVLIGPDALDGLGGQVWGKVAVLAGAVSYAFAGIYGRRLGHLPTSVAAAGMLSGSSVMMMPLVMMVETPMAAATAAGPTTLLSVAGLALLSTALAYMIYFHILARAGATNLLLVTFLIPVSALALGILVLGERLSPAAALGMGLIFIGLAAVDGRLLKKLRRRSTS